MTYNIISVDNVNFNILLNTIFACYHNKIELSNTFFLKKLSAKLEFYFLSLDTFYKKSCEGLTSVNTK